MLNTPELSNPLVIAEFNKIQEAAFRGFVKGCKKIYQGFSSYTYPVSSFVYDAAIIGAKTMNTVPEFSELHTLVTRCPEIYAQSNARMQERMSKVEQYLDKFKALDSDAKVEFLSEKATEFLVPGGIFKGIQAFSKFKVGASVGLYTDIYDKTKSIKDDLASHYLQYDPTHPESTQLVPTKRDKSNKAPVITQDDIDIFYDDIVEIKKLGHDVKQSYTKYTQCANDKACLHEWMSNVNNIATLGQGVSQLALLSGMHQRTWKNIGTVCSGLATMSSSLLTVSMSSSFLSLAGGYIGVGIGLLTSVLGIFGNDSDDNGLEQLAESMANMMNQMLNTIMDALSAIHQTMVDGFQRIENAILTSVIPRLIEINTKLDRLETITCLSFKELHTKSLVDLIDPIQKDLTGEYVLSVSERRAYIRELGTWIDCHSKSPLQTSLYRANANNDSIGVEVFSSFDRPLDYLNLLLLEITRLTNIRFDMTNLPNIPVYLIALDTYLSCALKYNENTEVLKRAKDTIVQVHNLIDQIKDNNCYDVLFRQYEYYRFLIGRQIEKCRMDYDNDHPLAKYLKYGDEYEKLLKLFDALELRRLMLIHTADICQMPIPILESKADILATKDCEKIIKAVYSASVNEDELKKALNIGLTVNHFDAWGQPIHYITRNKHGQLHKLIPILFQCSDVELNKFMKYNMNDTWGPAVHSMLYTLHGGSFEIGFLFSAQGHNINEVSNVRANYQYWENPWPSFYESDLGNAYIWEKDAPTCQFAISVAKTTNDPKSKFYRDHLRKSYNYYKTVASGLECDIEGTTASCLLLFACIIGDLYPLLYSKLQVDVNEKIESHGLTYLMLAAYCGHIEVVKYLMEKGSNIHAETDNAYKNAEYFAKLRNHDDIISLLQNGFQITEMVKVKTEPFNYAIQRIDSVLELSKNNNIVNKDNETIKLLFRLLKATVPKLQQQDQDLVSKYLKDIEINPDNTVKILEDIDTIYLINGLDHISQKIQKVIHS